MATAPLPRLDVEPVQIGDSTSSPGSSKHTNSKYTGLECSSTSNLWIVKMQENCRNDRLDGAQEKPRNQKREIRHKGFFSKRLAHPAATVAFTMMPQCLLCPDPPTMSSHSRR